RPRPSSTASCNCRRRSAAPTPSPAEDRAAAMVEPVASFPERLKAILQDRVSSLREALGEVTVEIPAEHWLEAARILRDHEELAFEQLIDLCGVDYLGWGQTEWETVDVSSEGFSRGVEGAGPG